MSMFNEWQLNDEFMPINNEWTPLPTDVNVPQVNTLAPEVVTPVSVQPVAVPVDPYGTGFRNWRGKRNGYQVLRPVQWKPRLAVPQEAAKAQAQAQVNLPAPVATAPTAKPVEEKSGWTIAGVTITPMMLALLGGGALLLLYVMSNFKGKK